MTILHQSEHLRMTGSGPLPPGARRYTRGRRLTVCPVAEDDMTIMTIPPLAQCAHGPGSGAKASDSTEGSHRHDSAPGRTMPQGILVAPDGEARPMTLWARRAGRL